MFEYYREDVEEPVCHTVCYCDGCGGDIYEGEEFYDVKGVYLHEDCLKEYFEEYLTTWGVEP